MGVLQKAPDVSQQNELFRAKCLGKLGGGGIGIDIVGGVGVHALGHGGHHRDVAAHEGVFHRLRVHAGDLAHQAVLFIQALRLKKLPVHAAKADGLAAQTAQLGHQVFIDLAAQHRLHHVHGDLIGIAQAVHKPGLVSQTAEHVGDLRPAAVHENDTDADEGHQHDVPHYGIFQFFVDHRVAAVLDDDGLSGEFLNIRQGLYQRLGLLCM